MSRIVIGAYAHVDGGKTTLSESILHKCGVLKESGRVDHEDSFLDFNPFERQKGITVYAKEARFSYNNKDFIYVDTPVPLPEESGNPVAAVHQQNGYQPSQP